MQANLIRTGEYVCMIRPHCRVDKWPWVMPDDTMSAGSPATAGTAAAAARISLATAALYFKIPTTSPAAEFTRNLLSWVDRSVVDEANFKHCRDLARGLAHSNENGMLLSESVTNANRQLQMLMHESSSLFRMLWLMC